MKKVDNELRVVHIPQVGCDKKFTFNVIDEEEANTIILALATQHLWLFENKFIPDFANILTVEMYDKTVDEETNKVFGWVDYFNEEECMDWVEFQNEYF